MGSQLRPLFINVSTEIDEMWVLVVWSQWRKVTRNSDELIVATNRTWLELFVTKKNCFQTINNIWCVSQKRLGKGCGIITLTETRGSGPHNICSRSVQATDLSTATQAARVEEREDSQWQASWQTECKVVSDGSKFLLIHDVTDPLQLMTTTQLHEVLYDSQTLWCTPLIKLCTYTHMSIWQQFTDGLKTQLFIQAFTHALWKHTRNFKESTDFQLYTHTCIQIKGLILEMSELVPISEKFVHKKCIHKQWLKCNETQGNAVPHLQFLGQRVPPPQILHFNHCPQTQQRAAIMSGQNPHC